MRVHVSFAPKKSWRQKLEYSNPSTTDEEDLGNNFRIKIYGGLMSCSENKRILKTCQTLMIDPL